MCGIFGITMNQRGPLDLPSLELTIEELFRLSESRGKEAAGIALLAGESIRVGKCAQAASHMIRTPEYRRLFDESFQNGKPHSLRWPVGIIGHSRLVTNGRRDNYDNNQPVITSRMVGVHNGIITNVDELWAKFPGLDRKYEVDTEVLLSLIRHFYEQKGDVIEAVRAAFAEIEGVASVAVLFEDISHLLLATNNGSLYLASGARDDLHVFASERYILKTLLEKHSLGGTVDAGRIQHLEPGMGFLIDPATMETKSFRLTSDTPVTPRVTNGARRTIIDHRPAGLPVTIFAPPSPAPFVLPESFVDEYPHNAEAVARLRRCTRCVLPETMPFIEFDGEGVCNFCLNYQKTVIHGLDALEAAVAPYRSKNGEPDCVVTFSGGRDSSYGVHYIKTVLKMNPVTYTYDWGMVTDLARRNQMRICGKLGLEHILVSADIPRKHRNIRMNVLAWLRKPDLGTVPLFMAGDKQYFFYANRVGQQTGCKLVVLCENLLETTGFKTGYCGISPAFGQEHTYTLSLASKLRLASYYSRQFATNPGYLNASILDTAWAYCCYYVIPHNYLNMYRYVPWDEPTIDDTLKSEYNWETAPDTQSTWRIGDGTASFYNYIYYTLAGLTEHDTFRSNQIREGMMSRDRALALVLSENAPRYESIQWYCDTIGIDFRETIEHINQAPKRYR